MLPRQGDNSKVEFLAYSSCRLNMAGGKLSKLSWGRSSLYAALAVDLPRLLPRLSLLQHCDDWRLGESAASPDRVILPENSTYNMSQIRGSLRVHLLLRKKIRGRRIRRSTHPT